MLKFISAALIFASVATARSYAHTPEEFLEVFSGKPTNLIEHGIDVKSFFDEQKIATKLKGPTHFSAAVGCLDRNVKKPKAYMSWYKIVDVRNEAPRNVTVVDLVRGAQAEPLTITTAEYFLSPAQRVKSGPPAKTPDGLDHYKAYRIVNGASVEIEIMLTDSPAQASRRLGKPLFLCVAAEEWHHDEHFRVSHRRDCFLVYQLDTVPHPDSFSLIDQFGLNQLGNGESQYLCVRAALTIKSEK